VKGRTRTNQFTAGEDFKEGHKAKNSTRPTEKKKTPTTEEEKSVLEGGWSEGTETSNSHRNV